MGNEVVRAQLVQAYADSLKVVWVTMCGLAAVALVASAATKGLDLNRPLETEQGFWVDEKGGGDVEKREGGGDVETREGDGTVEKR